MSCAILTNKKRSDRASLQIHSKLLGVNIESKGTCPDRVISAGFLLRFLAGGAAGEVRLCLLELVVMVSQWPDL